jgi:NAD(P)-dependent dehydrogenase (short-subunit alcohol dehydrogenase family)
LPTLAGHGSITFLGGAAAHIAMPGTVGRAAVHGALFANAAERLPAGKTGEPHEIAEAVTLCVTNRFVTGSVFDVDGGVRLT